MRASFVASIVLVVAAGGGLGCNVVIGVDEVQRRLAPILADEDLARFIL